MELHDADITSSTTTACPPPFSACGKLSAVLTNLHLSFPVEESLHHSHRMRITVALCTVHLLRDGRFALLSATLSAPTPMLASPHFCAVMLGAAC